MKKVDPTYCYLMENKQNMSTILCFLDFFVVLGFSSCSSNLSVLSSFETQSNLVALQK
jgi:hypothetical protein